MASCLCTLFRAGKMPRLWSGGAGIAGRADPERPQALPVRLFLGNPTPTSIASPFLPLYGLFFRLYTRLFDAPFLCNAERIESSHRMRAHNGGVPLVLCV